MRRAPTASGTSSSRTLSAAVTRPRWRPNCTATFVRRDAGMCAPRSMPRLCFDIRWTSPWLDVRQRGIPSAAVSTLLPLQIICRSLRALPSPLVGNAHLTRGEREREQNTRTRAHGEREKNTRTRAHAPLFHTTLLVLSRAVSLISFSVSSLDMLFVLSLFFQACGST